MKELMPFLLLPSQFLYTSKEAIQAYQGCYQHSRDVWCDQIYLFILFHCNHVFISPCFFVTHELFMPTYLQ